MIIIIGIAIFLVIGVLFRQFERSNIYFPSKIIESTPKDIGLEYEDIFFKTQDGALLNGWFIPVSKDKISLFPTIIFCHGNGGNISHRLETINIFHTLKLNVFIFDYRGYGKSKGRVSEKGTYLDALAAYNYLMTRDDINKNCIIVFGRSLGSAIAIDLATRVKVALLICESGFTSIMDMAKDVYKVRPPRWLLSHRYDALSKIKEIEVPKLIIHSKGDEMIPFRHGKRLFEEAKEPKEFYILKENHNQGFLLAGEEYLKRIKDFIEKYIDLNM